MAKARFKIRIGTHKNKYIDQVPTSWLHYAAQNLMNTEFHDHAMAAVEQLKDPAVQAEGSSLSLDEQATQFLARRGFDKHGRRA